jgi:hypothetical protein
VGALFHLAVLPSHAEAGELRPLCAGRCGGAAGPFAEWSQEEVEAYMEFVHLLLVDMLATDAGVMRYGVEREGNPLPRAVLYVGGLPLLWTAAAVYTAYIKAQADAHDPPYRLFFLRQTAFNHALGATLWIGTVGMRTDLSFRFTLFSVRW